MGKMSELIFSKHRKGRILVVDDEPLVLSMLAETLRQQGHDVVATVDAESALKEVEKGVLDLILTDLHLPGISGVELMVRAKEIHPTLAVVVVTGQPALDKAIEAMKKGAADFITKPFSIDYIHHVVQKNLQERSLVLENQRLLAELNNKAVIEQLNRQLHSKIEQLEKLYHISEAFDSMSDNSQMLQYVVDMAVELTGAQRVSIMTFDARHRFLTMRASRGVSDDVMRKVSLRVGDGVAGKVVQTRRPIRVTSKDVVGLSVRGNDSYGSNSWLSVPLFIGGEMFGVLNLTDKRDGSDFTEADEYLGMTLAEKAGSKIENNALYEGIYANLVDTLKALVSTIEAKDAYTRHHSQRVTEMALVLAREIGCSEEDLESIAFAGILHDVGKIGISDEILLKTSKLTYEEYQEIKKHPMIGAGIIEPLGLTQAERDIIRHHHERVDGRGYPSGLKGDEIPLLARIVSITDAFDAMTSTRSYRKALPMSVVIEELRKNAGTQFDAELVNVMIKAVEEGKIIVEGDEEANGAQQLLGKVELSPEETVVKV